MNVISCTDRCDILASALNTASLVQISWCGCFFAACVFSSFHSCTSSDVTSVRNRMRIVASRGVFCQYRPALLRGKSHRLLCLCKILSFVCRKFLFVTIACVCFSDSSLKSSLCVTFVENLFGTCAELKPRTFFVSSKSRRLELRFALNVSCFMKLIKRHAI